MLITIAFKKVVSCIFPDLKVKAFPPCGLAAPDSADELARVSRRAVPSFLFPSISDV
ncbi:hypothetical protein [Mastigocoleus sp. MO_188.B34]|uniref:hypothetical protein n=1 Tax=Mastigocoleus sp. MO_188.B34 TaxID=3036635 RepID=UPI00263356C5|nr:hypothetical protein [Mastigocoleus sp. MO_188.B34]MDJ0696123.1 hypothetical protein [Mastigocoleus sp. MO_188.B34]